VLASAQLEIRMAVPNRRAAFRDPLMRRAYDDCVASYASKSPLLFAADGRRAGNSASHMFWRGYDGKKVSVWDAASRRTFAYAQFRAGQDCAANRA
jgi:hypothetical protein